MRRRRRARLPRHRADRAWLPRRPRSARVGGAPPSAEEAAASALARLGERVVLMPRHLRAAPVARHLAPAGASLPRCATTPVSRWPAASRRSRPGCRACWRALVLEPAARESAPTDEAERCCWPRGASTGVRRERVNRFARGHPLSLQLAAGRRPCAPGPPELEDIALAGRGSTELTELYLSGLDPPTREVLDAASVVRRHHALAPRGDAAGCAPARRLRAPCARCRSSSSDPTAWSCTTPCARPSSRRCAAPTPLRYRRYRGAAWLQLRSELRTAAPADLWRYTADLLYLIENPGRPGGVLPDDAAPRSRSSRRRRPTRAAIDAIVRRHEPAAAREHLLAWWESAPAVFRVARDPERRPRRSPCCSSPTSSRYGLDPGRPGRQPLARAPARQPGAARPAGALSAATCWPPTAAKPRPPRQAPCWLDLKRRYLEMRPRLRRIYIAGLRHPDARADPVAPLGFARSPGGAAEIGRNSLPLRLYNDFGPSSIDGWLTDARRPGDAHRRPRPARSRPPSARPRRRPRRSHQARVRRPRSTCYEREGRVVGRAALLRDVWGYDWTAAATSSRSSSAPCATSSASARDDRDRAQHRATGSGSTRSAGSTATASISTFMPGTGSSLTPTSVLAGRASPKKAWRSGLISGRSSTFVR